MIECPIPLDDSYDKGSADTEAEVAVADRLLLRAWTAGNGKKALHLYRSFKDEIGNVDKQVKLIDRLADLATDPLDFY